MDGPIARAGQALAAFSLDLLRALVTTAAFLTLSFSLLALLGRAFATLDLIAHFAVPLFLAALIALAASLLIFPADRRGVAWLALAAAIASAVMAAPEYLARWRQPAAAATDDAVRLVQFNLWGANTDPAGTAAWIREIDADILVVEEASGAGRRVIDQLGDVYPHHTPCRQGPPCSTFVLSKFPILASDILPVPYSTSNIAWARLDHPQGPFTVVGVHHSWPEPLARQALQMAATKSLLEDFEPSSLIVAGDFNATPWSAALRRQDRLFGLERRTRAVSSYPARVFERRPFTFPAPFLPIDHVYAGEAWRTIQVKRGPRLGSDHYPVVVGLARRSTAE